MVTNVAGSSPPRVPSVNGTLCGIESTPRGAADFSPLSFSVSSLYTSTPLFSDDVTTLASVGPSHLLNGLKKLLSLKKLVSTEKE